VTRRPLLKLGVLLSCASLLAASWYLIAIGAGTHTRAAPMSPAETYLIGGGLLAGALGLAVCLGLLLRREAPAGGGTVGAEMPAE
jgi:hypothetical protein